VGKHAVGTAAVLAVIGVGIVARQNSPAGYPIQAVPLARVQVTGGFWQAKLETNRTVTIPHILQENEQTGRVDNFRKAAGQMPGDYQGRRFNDTDIYKIIEAASYTLVSHADPALAKQLDDLIALIAKAQQPDGYLFPARTVNPDKPAAGIGTERWQYENTGSHELYNAGHLFEAAIAHYQATGARTLFDVALKEADLIVTTFGPQARQDAPGHEVVEMALVRLYEATHDRRYLDEAKFLLDERGTAHHASLDYTDPGWKLYNDRAYRQDDQPVVDQSIAHGHAVRAMYLYSAMTDIAALLRDPAYNRAVDRLWQDVTAKRIYLTGGLGSIGGTEAFGDDYQLPNRTAYTETCASVGGILWNHRMFLKSGDGKYLDAFEQTLYNGYLSGVSVKGDSFFYQNPLESSGRQERSAYFDVACCPANLARLMAQLPGLIYGQRDNEVFVNLYMDSAASITLPVGEVRVQQTTAYPWDGRVALVLQPAKAMAFSLRLRTPGWLGATPLASDLYRFNETVADAVRVTVNGTVVPASPSRLGWLTIARRWSVGDRVELTLPMAVRRVLANPGVKDDDGKAAIERGPVVYALEGVDNGGKVLDVSVPLDAAFTPTFRPDLLGGVTTLGASVSTTGPDGRPMVRSVTAIPYFAWANRGRGEMVVWVKQ
jgi:DUF1680 family protein